MLSRWRKEARDGVLRGRATVPKTVKVPRAREVKRLQALQHKYSLLQEKHALLKKLASSGEFVGDSRAQCGG